jgi:hypothetical protein
VIPHLRERFNANFTETKYQHFLLALNQATATQVEFRPCETPVFLPHALMSEMEQAAHELIAQLCTAEYLAASTRAIPMTFRAPNEGAHPAFIQVDFAVTLDAEGRLKPKLIELQGCASLYAFQYLMPRAYQQCYNLQGLGYLLNGLTEQGYLNLFKRVVLKDCAPEQVVLLEIDPLEQKTLPDFRVTEKLLGVKTVDVSHVKKRGSRLFYENDGREIEIRRLYNRVIIDELVKKGVQTSFDFRDELDVEWAGHPNWYFRLSKFSLPFLNHPTVPRACFLDQLDEYPAELEQFVLKPLFSFAGSGVKVNLTRADLDTIPADQRGDYLLQEKVAYAPVINTPDEPSKVEIRLMFLWPDEAERPLAVTTLTRLSKGAMMGVDFNKNKTWVGSSCGFFERA